MQQPVTEPSRTSPDSKMNNRRMVSLPFRNEPGRPGPANGAPRSFEGSRQQGYLRLGKEEPLTPSGQVGQTDGQSPAVKAARPAPRPTCPEGVKGSSLPR